MTGQKSQRPQTLKFQRPLTVPLHSRTAGKLPAVRAVQGDCETVTLSGWMRCYISVWWTIVYVISCPWEDLNQFSTTRISGHWREITFSSGYFDTKRLHFNLNVTNFKDWFASCNSLMLSSTLSNQWVWKLLGYYSVIRDNVLTYT